jgi:hypothetical protein
MAKYPTERAPAKVTKCPHCNWTGSARGLFSHVRLTHGGKEHALNIRKENPYVIEKSKPRVLGSVISKTHRIDKNAELEEFVMKCIMKVIEAYKNSQDPLFRAKL